MLARRLPCILPALSESEALEVTADPLGGGAADARLAARDRAAVPRTAPHDQRRGARRRGNSPPRPGEVSLAHHGVLFLDELLEFRRHVVESLRQPLEDGHVTIARATLAVTFPARFTLVGAMNPCPCGAAATRSRELHVRGGGDHANYRSRLSGPLADRVDMHVHVGAVGVRALGDGVQGERSAAVRTRVEAARARQRARYVNVPGVGANAHAPARWLDRNGGVHAEARELLAAAAERLGFTARAYHRVLRVARTIADLDSRTEVGPDHIGEAIGYRPSR